MPKEFTHWWLAAETRERLRSTGEAPALLRVLDENPNLFLLGSVGPDYLFYYMAGKELENFREAAMILHGTDGGNTLAALSAAEARYAEGIPEPVWAFLFGYVCHVMSDAAFHPLVLHFVGKGTDRNRYEHHVFESSLDLYVKDILRRKVEVPATLAEMTGRMEMDREEFLSLLGTVSFGGKPYDKKALAACLRRYEWIQARFWSPLGRFLASAISRFNPNMSYFEASFYQRRFASYARAFAGEIAFRHPVTGEEKRNTVEGLKDEAAAAACGVAAVLEPLIQDRSLPPRRRAEIVGGLQGPNLETGIPGDKAEADTIVHTAPEGLRGLIPEYAGFPWAAL